MRKSVPLALLVLGLVLALTGFSTVAAAEVTDSITVSFTVTSHQVIQVSPPSVDFGDVWPGMTTPQAQTVTVTCKSNVLWDLNYQAPADFGNAELPIGVLKYDATTAFVSGTYNLLSSEGKTASKSTDYSYSLDTNSIPWTVDPLAYQAAIVYQLVPSP